MPSTTVSAPIDADFQTAVEAAKLAALYNFAYGLSHEINNPLANISTRAQTLLADEKNPDHRRKLATIVQQAFRAHEMIADLMLFARPPTLKREPTDLINLANTVIAELQDRARDQNTVLLRTGVDDPLIASIDPTQIAVALKAMLQNALEATKQGGRVEINLRSETEPLSTQYSVLSTDSDHRRIDAAPPSAVPPPLSPVSCSLSPSYIPHSALRSPHFLLSISDTGPGIPPQIRSHIFDPFYSGREAGRGLGLGLSKAWRIINLHGGQIGVASPPGQGATFTIALPIS